MVTDITRLLLLVARILNGLHVRFAVGGSLASSHYGELRATNDIDLMVDLPAERVPAFVAALKPHFDIWEDTIQSAVESGQSFGSLHVEWHVKVDFFPMGAGALDLRTMERRKFLALGPDPALQIPFASAEDIVLRKLEWFCKSDGVLERQLRDIAGVLKFQGRGLDLAYLRAMADDLGVGPQLGRCLVDAGLE